VSDSGAVNVLHVDNSRCCGYGMCADLAPDVFALDDDGFVVAKTTEVPDELMPATEDAVYSCPERVLTLSKKPS